MDSKFSSNFFHHSSGLTYYYRYKHTFNSPHTFLSSYIKSCLLVSFPLPFVWYCPQVVPHLSICMFSLFLSVILTSGLLAITSFSVCTPWTHNTVTSSCSILDWASVCVCAPVGACKLSSSSSSSTLLTSLQLSWFSKQHGSHWTNTSYSPFCEKLSKYNTSVKHYYYYYYYY